MKSILYIAVALWSGTVLLPSTHAVGEDVILKFLEEFRNRMCHPIDKWGLPAIDPFYIQHAEFKANNKYLINFTGSVMEFYLRGLSDFIVNDLRVSPTPLRPTVFDITLPFLGFKSNYTAKGSLAYIFNLAGDGDAEAYVENFRLAISFNLNADLKLSIHNLSIIIQIGRLHVDFENLIEEPRVNDFLHALINDLGLELLHDIWEVEGEAVTATIEKNINSIIGQYTLANIISIIGSGGDAPIFGDDDPLPDCKEALIN